MNEKIINYCKEIEKEYNIKILFAVESGSRLWRMHSKDSDYDVRFVFVQKIEKYLSIKNNLSTELVINEDYEDKTLDFSGFDIFKYCKLLAKSNPSVIEWLQSDILYYGEKPARLKKIAFDQFNTKGLFYHYKSMCKQNYEKYLKSKQHVTYKKYLYSMRGLINAKFIENTGNLPPIKFTEILDQCKKIIPKEVIDELKDTIEKKKIGKEKEIIKNIVTYDQYIEEFLQENKEIKSNRSPNKDKINEELRKIILQEK